MIFTTKRLDRGKKVMRKVFFDMPVILMLDRLQDGHPIKVWNKV